jgi:ferredoxin
MPYAQHVVDHAKCTRCDICRRVCPVDCIHVN